MNDKKDGKHASIDPCPQHCLLVGCAKNEKETVGVLVAVNYESDAFMDAWDLKSL
jgi:hypothetical protein